MTPSAITGIEKLERRVVRCRKCPRLVGWREKVAREKTRRFSEWDYWGKPSPGFGDPKAELLLVGLAPAAHGGNRTGRMFTGDRSGDWLYRALYKAGFANQPQSTDRNDGLHLKNCFITAACRCAPPQNRLLPSEIASCRPFLLGELRQLKRVRVVVGLGKVGFDNAWNALREVCEFDAAAKQRRPKFGHGVEYELNGNLVLIGSFHPSQQNTFTKKLTEKMLDAIFKRAKIILEDKS